MIEFLLKPEDDEVFPPPGPSKNFLPEWYKALEQRVPDNGKDFPVGTVKKCVPFLDAMTAGYIIPLPVSIRVVATDEGVNISWLDSAMDFINEHSAIQLPGAAGHIFKFMSPWIIRLPEGYSAIFTTPFSHRLPFKLFDGVVDLDTYHNEVNFPFVWTQFPYDGVLHAGTPMAQIIPFKREEWGHEVRVREGAELTLHQRISRKLSAEGIDGYRKHFWRKKIFR